MAAKDHLKTLVKLNVFALGTMYLANKFIYSVSSSRNMLKPGAGSYYSWKHGEVFYQKAGNGDPIILLHRLDPASCSYEWNEVIDQIAKYHTVYAIDLPGCGRSDKDAITYTNYFYVTLLHDFIHNVVKEPVTIIASGYSSSFALMAKYADQNMISKVIAVNPLSLGELEQTADKKSKVVRGIAALPIIGTTLYSLHYSRFSLDDTFTEDYVYNPFRSKQRFVDAFYESSHYKDGDGKYLRASIDGHYMTVNIRKALETVGSSVTILNGGKYKHSTEITREYQHYCPDIHVFEIPKTSLVPHMEKPDDFVDTLNLALGA